MSTGRTGWKAGACLLAGTAVWLAAGSAQAAVTADEIKKELGLSVYLQGGYTFNFEDPKGDQVNPGRWETQSNGFTFDLAELQFLKEAAKGSVGYKVKLIAGDFAKEMNQFGIGITTESSSSAFDVMEAFIEYVAPVGNGVKLRAGRMGTFHGAEVLEARDNPTYSRSFLFVYAEPLTHTGLSALYNFSDTLNAGFHVVNGWDDTTDNNRGKTVGLNVNYAPVEMVSAALNLMYGPEQADQSGHNRFLATTVVTLKPVKPATLILAADYGTERKVSFTKTVWEDDGEGTLTASVMDYRKNATWWGAALTVKYDLSDALSFAARGEYFDDQDGARTAWTGTDSDHPKSAGQKLKEVTLAAEWRPASGLVVKPEYRHDWSDKKFFSTSDKTLDKKSQDTVSVAMAYTW